MIDNEGWDSVLYDGYDPKWFSDEDIYSDTLEMFYSYHNYLRHRNIVYNWLEKEVYNVGSDN